ncbi:MAG: signal peptidase II [Pseudomonadota bacterium]
MSRSAVRRSKYRVPLILAALVVVVDQFCKWAVEAYMPFQVKWDVLPFFALFRTYNEGIAFSMLSGLGAGPLIALATGVSLFVLWLWRDSAPERVLSHFGFALIIGGAVGNLIDRARLGYVIDYFLFHLPEWSFAVFNLADSAITVGAGLVLLDELITWWRQSEKETTTGES